MDRRVSTQDITWFLDLSKAKQLNLDPPYQRRSVWTSKDRKYFLDTIFRNYPSPAIFLHKEIDATGSTTYHVVDGKQRLNTILSFVSNKLKMGDDFGDARLSGKRWKELSNDVDLRRTFWNYQVTVEVIDVMEGELVNGVFDRLNRNSRKLTPQELRHARYDGWFITTAETETEDPIWRAIGVTSAARSKRMMDVQFMSELMALTIAGQPVGFDQLALDELYAAYDDISELENFSEEGFREKFGKAKAYVGEMESHNKVVSRRAKGFGHFYSLWGAVSLAGALPAPDELANRYDNFMDKVDELAALPPGAPAPQDEAFVLAATYRENARGASTEPPQRLARQSTLMQALGLE